IAAAAIIGFVLLVGGAFSVLQATGAVDQSIRRLAAAHSRHRFVEVMWIPIFMGLFSLGGAVFGMSEEVIPFILVFVPLSLRLGYDSIVGVAVPFVGAGAGFAGAFLNPFTVGVAQDLAGVRQFSGVEYRLVCWTVLTGIAITWVTVYARRVKRHPEKSPTFAADRVKRAQLPVEEEIGGDGRRTAALLVFLGGMGLLVWGVLAKGWYIQEIAALFVGLALVIAVVGRLSAGDAVDAYVAGAKDLVGTALIIALARGILVIAENGRIIDSILRALANSVEGFGAVFSAQLMFLVQTALNFFVPSGSGQAALTMPIMAPLADLVGVSRQTAVLAFQFGDGFSNLIIPTSAVCMGVLSLAEIPWTTWARWMLPLQILFVIAGCLLLAPVATAAWG
ncbi:MAG: TIGR00366 family protein, partial [Acidobacteriota bacterium]